MKNVAIFLFDESGIMAQPWLQAGYECWLVDIKHKNPSCKSNLHKIKHDLSRPWYPPFGPENIAFVAAFPPCDHLAVSGSRWFRGKGLRKLAESINLFATAAEFCEWSQAPYMIENPVSTISSYWRKPDHYFQPYYFTGLNISDNYTKKTALWVGGGFAMPPRDQAPRLPFPDDRIHKAPPSEDRAEIRSKTPLGFARAVFAANSPLADHPQKFQDLPIFAGGAAHD